MTGEPLSITTADSILADNSLLHDEIMASFGEIFKGHLRTPLPTI